MLGQEFVLSQEGSVTRLLNTNADTIEKYRYDVFGNPLIVDT